MMIGACGCMCVCIYIYAYVEPHGSDCITGPDIKFSHFSSGQLPYVAHGHGQSSISGSYDDNK